METLMINRVDLCLLNPPNYTSRGDGCGFYSELILVESKALKQAHSKLRNWFSNAAIGKKWLPENCNRGRAK